MWRMRSAYRDTTMTPIRRHHSTHVIALTSRATCNARRNVLLLARPGGRVLGSNDQMTLLQALGTPEPPVHLRARNGVDGSG
jgi:hypothetical protein